MMTIMALQMMMTSTPKLDIIHSNSNYTVHVAPTQDATLCVGKPVYHIRNNKTGVDEFETGLEHYAILMANELNDVISRLDRSLTLNEYMDDMGSSISTILKATKGDNVH